MLIQRYKQEYASIPSIKFDEVFDPLRSEILDYLPEIFEDEWVIWVTQMDDLWPFEQKNMTEFMIDRMKGKYPPSITNKKNEMIRDIWEENQKRYKELVSEFGKLVDAILEKVKPHFKAFKINPVQL